MLSASTSPSPLELSPIETILVWGIREWVSARRVEERERAALRIVFRNHGIESVATAIRSLLRATAACATRSLEIRHPSHRGVSEDEARFVAVIALQQWSEATLAFEILSTWLPPTGVRVALETTAGAAEALRLAGHVLPLRRWEFAELEGALGSAHSILDRAVTH